MKFEDLKDGYHKLWQGMVVLDAKIAATNRQARHIIVVKDHYLDISSSTNVPWFVLGIIHLRESGDPPDFKAVLHNGERIIGTGRRTTLVPKGRGPFIDFTTAGIDAVRMQHLDAINWQDGWGPEHVAFVLENFNGFGYRNHGLPSPYLWGSTNRQKPGKYIRDGVFDRNVIDQQIGGMALLNMLMYIDPTITFDTTPVIASAKAVDAEEGELT